MDILGLISNVVNIDITPKKIITIMLLSGAIVLLCYISDKLANRIS